MTLQCLQFALLYSVDAMKETHAIRFRRYGQHIKSKLKPGKQVARATELARVRNAIHLIRAPGASASRVRETNRQAARDVEMIEE